MNWFLSLFFKITTLIVFISYNAFAGGLEVSRQNNMILFSDGKTVNFQLILIIDIPYSYVELCTDFG